MATNNSVNSGLAGTTGTGNFVGGTSPTISTPTINGVTNASSAGSGVVGEVISSTVAAPGNSISTATDTNLTSLSLTAGDWTVHGNVGIAGTGTLGSGFAWISTTSATLPAAGLYSGMNIAGINGAIGITAPSVRINVNSTTTVYLSARTNITSGTATIQGTIFARRER